MSAFFAALDYAAEPVDRAAAERALAALRPLGRDGERLEARGSLALGHQRFWCTPEEVGEEQPLDDGRRLLLFDGRLDNRGELLAELGELPPGCSDARLVQAALERWAWGAPDRLLGPFVLVSIDRDRRSLLAARDPLGDRRLVYARRGTTLLLATHERALLGAFGLSRQADEESLGRYLAYRAPAPGRTFYGALSELPPGHSLRFGPEGLAVERYAAVSRPRRRRLSDAEAADRFRDLLGEAVECRLRVREDAAGVMMSGGLDSTSIAALAAGRGRRTPAVGWVFDRLEECDERRFSSQVVERYDLPFLPAGADELSPLDPGGVPLPPPEVPSEDLYLELLRAALTAARDHGLRCLLTGHYANQLWEGGDYWLRDLVAAGRWATATAGFARLLAGRRWRRLRSASARLAGWNGGSWRHPEWLTREARELCAVAPQPVTAHGRGEVERWGAEAPFWNLGVALLRSTGLEAGIDLRFPYRDRRLTDFVLSAPADLLYRPPVGKWLQRRALAGLLPEPVRRRERPTDIFAWAGQGLFAAGDPRFRIALGEAEPVWSRFVRSDWLWPRLEHGSADPPAAALAWRCAGLGAWCHRHATC